MKEDAVVLLVGGALARTVGAFGVLCVRGLVAILRFAAVADARWSELRQDGRGESG